jgi:hypothetical protein
MQGPFGNGLALMVEERLGGIAEEFGDFSAHGSISVVQKAADEVTSRPPIQYLNDKNPWAMLPPRYCQ